MSVHDGQTLDGGPLGPMTLVDADMPEDFAGTWEYTLDTPDGPVHGQLFNTPDSAPDPALLAAVQDVARRLPAYRALAMTALREYLQEDEGLDFTDEEPQETWLALSDEDFDRRFTLTALNGSDEARPVLLFEVTLDGEHGLGVEFSGENVTRVDLGAHF